MQMTTADKRRRVEEILRLNHDLVLEEVTLRLQIEEEEERPESLRALWCRAWLRNDMPECDRLLALQYPKVSP